MGEQVTIMVDCKPLDWWSVINVGIDGESSTIATARGHRNAVEIRDALNYVRAMRRKKAERES